MSVRPESASARYCQRFCGRLCYRYWPRYCRRYFCRHLHRFCRDCRADIAITFVAVFATTVVPFFAAACVSIPAAFAGPAVRPPGSPPHSFRA